MVDVFYTVADEPSMNSFDAGGSIALGEIVTILAPVTFLRGRWHSPDAPSANVTYKLWTAGATPVALTPSIPCDQQPAPPFVAQDQFVTFTPGASIPLAAGSYWVVIEIAGSGGGGFSYNAISHFFDTSPVVRGAFFHGPPGFGNVGDNPNTFGTFTSSYTVDWESTPASTRTPDFMPFFL